MHSLMDGLEINLAFQVSSVAGLIVAIAVLAYDFLDGADTVALSFAGGGVPTARCDGFSSARLLVVPQAVLGRLLAFFLYIGAGGLLPRSREGGAGITQVGATWRGLTFIDVLAHLAAL